jgi:putative ABC transport system permease protein
MIRVLLLPIRALLSLDRWQEIFDTMSRNALRAALTAVSVGWGVFMLVVLLGMGHGLENGMKQSFAREASNTISIRGARTSIAAGGFDVGRTVRFDNRDYERAKKVTGVDRMTGRFFIRGGAFGGAEMMTRRGTKANAFSMSAVHPDALYLEQQNMVAGRFINDVDLTERRKSIVVGQPIVDFLFEPEEKPIGEWITVGSVAFQIVGIFHNDAGSDEERQMYIPVTTAQVAFNGQDRLNMLVFTVGAQGQGGLDAANRATEEIKSQLAQAHLFDLNDTQAIRVQNNVEGFERFSKLFFMISVFVIFIGGLTIGAGVIGVSNIMMITVKERTKEIGVRKALGATPLAIVSLIVQESVVLTAFAGLSGMAAGVGLLAGLSKVIPPDGFLRDPSIHLSAGLAATGVLVFFGALAGLFPALAAARVNPIQSLRDQ